MRQIKFRCWDLENKVWHMPTEWGEEPADAYIGHGVIPEIGFRSSKYFIWLQFTGLKDKNGKEIYEGDICTYKTGKKSGGVYAAEDILKGQVRFDDGQFEIGNHNGYGGVWEGLSYLLGSYHKSAKEFEIIGNIYENPNLIK